MINVQDLRFTYPGMGQPALRGVSFQVRPGEIFGFLGPSGAGKSTTQKILIGLLRGYQGTVDVFGKALSAWGADYYERIGISFETPNHFLKLTALENLRYFGALYSRERLLDPMDILARVGLENEGDLRVAQYSKGMKNRLSVARALLHQPELIFLDEPTAGLDPVNSRRVRDLVLEQKQAGRTVFLTTHDMAIAAEMCDWVAFLVDGQVHLLDTPKALSLQYGRAQVRVEFGSNGALDEATFPLERLGDNTAFIDLLRSQPVRTLHSCEATLEDIFIQSTGRSLE